MANKEVVREILKAIAQASATILKDSDRIETDRESQAKDAKKAPPPIKFKAAVGRKYSFPFRLVQSWVVSFSLCHITNA